MTTRRPQRQRRRTAPATSLPRPAAAEAAVGPAGPRAPGRSSRHRAHHVTTDYHYVRRDLLTIIGVGGACLAFIFGMAFYIGAL